MIALPLFVWKEKAESRYGLLSANNGVSVLTIEQRKFGGIMLPL